MSKKTLVICTIPVKTETAMGLLRHNDLTEVEVIMRPYIMDNRTCESMAFNVEYERDIYESENELTESVVVVHDKDDETISIVRRKMPEYYRFISIRIDARSLIGKALESLGEK